MNKIFKISAFALLIFASSVELKIQASSYEIGGGQKGPKKRKRKQQQKQVVVQREDKDETVETQLPANAYLIDELKVVVFGSEEKSLITRSEAERKALDGKEKTLDDLILERLMFLDGMKYKIMPEEDEIDRYLMAIQRDNNMTLDDLKALFKSANYTYEEGRQQFGMMSVVNKLLDFKIRSRLIVPEKEVLAYYNEHPEIQETAYYIQRALIPYSPQKNRNVQREEVEAFAKEGIGMVKPNWMEPFWVNKSDLAENKSFFNSMNPDEISMPEPLADGFEIFRLVQKREERKRPLEERYREITDLLRRPKYEQLLNDYKSGLYDTASILMFS